MKTVKININGERYTGNREALINNSNFFQKILSEPNSDPITVDLRIPESLLPQIDIFLYLIGDLDFNLDLFSLSISDLHQLLLLAEYFEAPQMYPRFITPLLQKELDEISLDYLEKKFGTSEVRKILSQHHLKRKRYLDDLPPWVRDDIIFDEEIDSFSAPPLILEIEGSAPIENPFPEKYPLMTKKGHLVFYPYQFDGDFLYLNSYIYFPELNGIWVDDDDLTL